MGNDLYDARRFYTELHDGELTEDSVKTALTSMAPGGEKHFAGLLPYLLIFSSLHRCTPNLHCGTERRHHPTTSHYRSHFHARVLRGLDTAQAVTHTEGKLRITYPSVGRLSAPATSAVYNLWPSSSRITRRTLWPVQNCTEDCHRERAHGGPTES
jgi:hypothetical protein